MPRLIISYRRSDSEDIAGRIRDRLAAHYGAKTVYMDIDDIPPGVDFREDIQKAFTASDILIAIVGPKWLGPLGRKRWRINDANDPVRVEIETALQKWLRIVPVLVNNATMPRPEDLPESIRDFSYRNAVAVNAGTDFHHHVDRLIEGLDYPRGRPKIRWFAYGAAAALVAAMAGLLWLSQPLSWLRSLTAIRGPVATKPSNGTGGPWTAPPGMPTDKPAAPPAGASIWKSDDGSKFYLWAQGQAREFVFYEPTPQMKDLGARPGDWVFKGWRIDEVPNERAWYEGDGYFYTGGCGTGDRRASYKVKGPVFLPQNVVVQLSGEVPTIDPASCTQKRAPDGKLLTETKTMVLEFTGEKK